MLGVVLAGGSSQRMGSDKAQIEVAGSPMIAWVVAALEEACERVLISGRADGWGGRQGLTDLSGVKGPLAGLAAALQFGEPVLLVAVDQPWIRAATLRKLAEIGTTAVPIHHDVRQVTCACYFPEMAAAAFEEAEKRGSVQSLLDRIVPLEITDPVWSRWGEDGRSWFSVDKPADVEVGLERFGVPGS